MQHYSRLAYDKTPRSSGHIILEGRDMESFNKEVRPGIQIPRVDVQEHPNFRTITVE
jgi:hypothetical protein